MGAAAILLARATPPPSCHGEVLHHIAGVLAIVNLITMFRGFARFPAAPSILPSVLRKSVIARGFGPQGSLEKILTRLYRKSILYADFRIRETLGQIPLPVRCQAVFWWPDFRCRMVRQNALKRLISQGSSMLTECFWGPKEILPLSTGELRPASALWRRGFAAATPERIRVGPSNADLSERFRPIERGRCREPSRRFPQG